jgi:hypothetical protein
VVRQERRAIEIWKLVFWFCIFLSFK